MSKCFLYTLSALFQVIQERFSDAVFMRRHLDTVKDFVLYFKSLGLPWKNCGDLYTYGLPLGWAAERKSRRARTAPRAPAP